MPANNRFIAWGILLTLVMIWGTSFILIKRGLEYFSSDVVGALRISVSFVILLPFALSAIRKIPAGKWRYIIVIAIIGTGFPAFLFAKAQTVIHSSVAGVLNSLTPLFTLIFGLVFFRLKTGWKNILGVMVGMFGAIGLIMTTGTNTWEFRFSYALLIVVATVMYALQSNMLKYYLQDVPPVTISSTGFLLIGPPVVLYLFFFSDFVHVVSANEQAWKGVVYVSILGMLASAFAIILYNKLIQMTTAIFATSVTYVIPVIALLWGTYDGERIAPVAFGFIIIILIGVFLVNFDYDKKKS